MQNTKAAIYAQKAFAKFVINKKLNSIRLLVSFNNTVTQQTANYASGDVCFVTDDLQYKQQALTQAVNNAKATLRTNNIVFTN